MTSVCEHVSSGIETHIARTRETIMRARTVISVCEHVSSGINTHIARTRETIMRASNMSRKWGHICMRYEGHARASTRTCARTVRSLCAHFVIWVMLAFFSTLFINKNQIIIIINAYLDMNFLPIVYNYFTKLWSETEHIYINHGTDHWHGTDCWALMSYVMYANNRQ